MAKQQSRGSGGVCKYGRNSDKCKKYAIGFRRYHNKLKRIRQSNGDKAAKQYKRQYSQRYMARH